MSRYAGANIILCVALIFVAIGSLLYGRADMSVADVINALFGDASDPVTIIVRELRLPRVILGIVIGAAMGVSGAALQGVLRNPLADPGVVGVSASAALGAVIAIHLGLVAIWPLSISIFAMAGALAATFILFIISARDSSVLMLILAGIGISSPRHGSRIPCDEYGRKPHEHSRHDHVDAGIP